MTNLTTVAFRGGDILVTTDQQIALKPVCDAMGLDYSGQLQRLKRQPWATVGVTPTVAEDGKTREMATVDRRTFTMWLATVETGRLKDENVREQVAIFQNEAADVLDAHFHGAAEVQRPMTREELLSRAVLEATSAISELEVKNAQLELEVEHAAPAVRYFDKFVCDTDALRIDDWGKQHGLDGRKPYEHLVEKGAIYKRNIGERWSVSKGKKITECEYRPRAGWQAYFDLRPQHNAPRYHNGQVRQTLYVKAGMSVELATKVGLAGEKGGELSPALGGEVLA